MKHVYESVQISSCRHYRGWRYGCFGNNLYEDYIVGIIKGESKASLRKQFLRRIVAIRGETMSDLLGIQTSRIYPPWVYPWSWKSVYAKYKPVFAKDNPDIVCHTSPDGFFASHLDREFAWCEGAMETIRQNGYQPKDFSYVKVLRLVGHNGLLSHIVLDGNHRISVLAALDVQNIEVTVCSSVCIKNLKFWPGVIAGRYALSDAAAIFDRYFIEENRKIEEKIPRSILNIENNKIYLR